MFTRDANKLLALWSSMRQTKHSNVSYQLIRPPEHGLDTGTFQNATLSFGFCILCGKLLALLSSVRQNRAFKSQSKHSIYYKYRDFCNTETFQGIVLWPKHLSTWILVFIEEGRTIHKHFGKERSRLALYVLNKLNLVPEHVETRGLYNKTQQPTTEQVNYCM